MEWENKIIDYLNGELPADQESELLQAVKDDPDLHQMMEEYKLIFSDIEHEKLELPSAEMSKTFENTLDRYDNEKVIRWSPFRMMAYASAVIFLLFAGISVWNQYSQSDIIAKQSREIVALKKEVMDKLNSSSVTGRIQAVNVASESASQDEEVITLLIKTMEEDESANVRLAAVEALATMEHSSLAREAVMRRLAVEEDPFVKIALIQAIVQLKENGAENQLEKITIDDQVPTYIKEEAHIAKVKLNQI